MNRSADVSATHLPPFLPGLVFLGAVAVVLGVLDLVLARKVGGALERARAALHVPPPTGSVGGPAAGSAAFLLEPLGADLCNALTGGVWFSRLLPRTRRAMAFDDLIAEPVDGACRRHSRSNGVIFRAGSRGPAR